MFSHFFSIFPSSLFPNPGSDLRLWIMQPWPLPSPGCWGHFHPPTATNISSVVRNTVRKFGEIQLNIFEKYNGRRSNTGCWGHFHPPTATNISSVVRNTLRRLREIQLNIFEKYSERNSDPGCWGHFHQPPTSHMLSVFHSSLLSSTPSFVSHSSCIGEISRMWSHVAKGAQLLLVMPDGMINPFNKYLRILLLVYWCWSLWFQKLWRNVVSRIWCRGQ